MCHKKTSSTEVLGSENELNLYLGN